MEHYDDSEALAINYLLGALPEEKMELFERRYLEDEALFEELQEIEDELIDDYVTGALSSEQRGRFEEYYLRSQQRREKLELARAMTEHAVEWKNQREASESSSSLDPDVSASGKETAPAGKILPIKRWSRPVPAWRQWAAIAAAVLIAIGSGVLWLRNRELRRELLATDSTEARLRQEAEAHSAIAEKLQAEVSAKEQEKLALSEELARLRSSITEAPSKVVVNILLTFKDMLIGGTRGGPVPTIRTLNIPANAQSVRLVVEVDKDKYRTFNVTLQRHNQNPIWSRSGVKPQAKKQSIILNIPADRLQPGDYTLVLGGVTPEGNAERVGTYYLKAVRR